jgi:eukaryotic-like serine/threonine-protein kinase
MASPVHSAQVFRFGLFELDVAQNALTRNGVRVKVADQSLCVLIYLLESPGKIVTREELRQKLWPDGTYVDFDGSLNVILKRLRAALSDDSENPRFIETIPRRGYRFIAPVSIKEATNEAEISAVQALPAAELSSVRTGAASRWSAFRWVAAVAVLFALIGTVWLYRHGKEPVGNALDISLKANAHVTVRKSVAVLGFHNVSGRPDDAWLSTAFSEMLSTELAGGEKLRLVSGEEVANLRVSSPWSQTDSLDPETTSRIGTALNSDLLILGSYTAAGKPDRGQLRLDVRLQDAKTGEILTEIAQTGDRQDLFQLVSGVGTRLRSRLGVPQLAEPEQASVAASLPSNAAAARFYSLGLAKLRDFEALVAKDLLEQAIKEDPKFPLSHSMLAQAWAQLGYEQKRKNEAKKALDLSANLPRVSRLLVEGDYYESLAQHEKAASTYRALFELFPDSVEYGLQLATAQKGAGHLHQAEETITKLRRLPKSSSDDPRIDLLDVRVGPTNDPARLELIRNAIRKASTQGKKMVYARARAEECLNLLWGEHPDQASASCDDAYNVFLAAGNRLMAADTLRLMGDQQGSAGHYQPAIATYQRALKILQELGEHAKTGTVLNNMAINFANEGELDRAEILYRQAKFHFEQSEDKPNTAIALANIADISYLRGDLSGAAKLYEQSAEIIISLEHGDPAFPLYRLADLRLAQGRVQDARRLAQQSVELGRAHQGAYAALTEAMLVLGEVSEAEGDLQGAQQQLQAALDIRQKAGDGVLVQENQVQLADLALEQGRAGQAESLLRAAIATFEKEKATPDTTNSYTLLSQALLMQRKTSEARKVIEHAADLSQTSPDPALKLPIAIQTARVEIAEATSSPAGSAILGRARQRLQSSAATAKRLGYYMVECEARLALGEMEMKAAPQRARTHLMALAAEAHGHGFDLLARRARLAINVADSFVAANKPTR